jgi:hypothetical protein
MHAENLYAASAPDFGEDDADLVEVAAEPPQPARSRATVAAAGGITVGEMCMQAVVGRWW